MRASHHNGRTTKAGRAFNVSHNDRTFDIKKAGHINPDKLDQNLFYVVDGVEMVQIDINEENLKEYELRNYETAFGSGLEKTNQNYIKNRHKERCRTMEQLYTNPKTCPQECILQVGKEGSYRNRDKFVQMVLDYCNQYNDQFASNSIILDVAIHCDEKSYHAHVRRIFFTEKDDDLYLNQNKALEEMGFDLPDPEKPRSRFNNRLQTFTTADTKLWHDVIRTVDPTIELQSVPAKSKQQHLEKIDYQVSNALKKYKYLVKELQKGNTQKNTLENLKKNLLQELATLDARLNANPNYDYEATIQFLPPGAWEEAKTKRSAYQKQVMALYKTINGLDIG